MSAFKEIQKTSDQVKNAIKQLSAYSLPNNPSERGITPEQIKKRFYDPILSSAASALCEIDRVVRETNGVIREIDQAVATVSETADAAVQTSERAETASAEAAASAQNAANDASFCRAAAETAVLDAKIAESAAVDAQNAILGMEVVSETADAGMPALAQAEIVDGKIVLKLMIPRGVQGIQGVQGERGEGFVIKKVYASVEELKNGFEGDGLPEGSFVLVRTKDETAEDFGKLYVRRESEYEYMTDMSVSIKGDKGEQGYTPVRGVDYWTTEDLKTISNFIGMTISQAVPEAVDERVGVIENGSY